METINPIPAMGARPSKKDKRDIRDPHLALAVPYPTVYETDISGMSQNGVSLLAGRYQKLLGVCVACSTVTYVEYLYYKKTGVYVKLSVAFLYIIIKRFVDGNINEGTSIRSAIKAVMKYGICTEVTFPTNYDLSYADFMNQKIPSNAYREALNYTIGGYVSIPIDRSFIAGGLFKYGLLLTRYDCGSTWWTPSWLPKDIFPLLKPKSVVSGHAVDEHEYDLTKPKTNIRFLNWWSEAWGNRGKGEHVLEDYAPTEAWALTLDSVLHLQDNSPVIADSVWRRLMDWFRSAGILKAFIK